MQNGKRKISGDNAQRDFYWDKKNSLLAAAMNVDEYEQVTQSDSLCVGSGFKRKNCGDFAI